jgi:CrcB protein
MEQLVLIFLGGGLGACSRYLISQFANAKWGADFPMGTLIANIVGCFIIGVFMAAITEKYIINPNWRLLIVVGFIGGLTTFSSFSYESLRLLQDGGLNLAMVNILTNMVLGFTATWLGMLVVRII